MMDTKEIIRFCRDVEGSTAELEARLERAKLASSPQEAERIFSEGLMPIRDFDPARFHRLDNPTESRIWEEGCTEGYAYDVPEYGRPCEFMVATILEAGVVKRVVSLIPIEYMFVLSMDETWHILNHLGIDTDKEPDFEEDRIPRTGCPILRFKQTIENADPSIKAYVRENTSPFNILKAYSQNEREFMDYVASVYGGVPDRRFHEDCFKPSGIVPGTHNHCFGYMKFNIVTSATYIEEENIWRIMMSYSEEGDLKPSSDELLGFLIEAGIDTMLPIECRSRYDQYAGHSIHDFIQVRPEAPIIDLSSDGFKGTVYEQKAGRLAKKTDDMLSLDPARIRSAGSFPISDQTAIASAHKYIASSPFVKSSRKFESIDWLHERKMHVFNPIVMGSIR